MQSINFQTGFLRERRSNENKGLDLFSPASYRRRSAEILYRNSCNRRVGYVVQKIKEDSTFLDARIEKVSYTGMPVEEMSIVGRGEWRVNFYSCILIT